MRRFVGILLAAALAMPAADIPLAGLQKPVEILRDKWGIPHIYAQTADDLFFAQGYIAARDRLFQIDTWRRVGTGRLAEVLGPAYVGRDRIARLVKYRGDWEQEWNSYSPDARQIATAFVAGINAYIRALGGKRPVEFQIAGYDPGLWEPEDVCARIAGLLMIRNFSREVARAQDIQRFGLDIVRKHMPADPPVPIEIPRDLDLEGISPAILKDYNDAIGPVRIPDIEGSNNWVVSGARSATGKPLLANDPHRPIYIPSLRKTVHLVGPGWNVIGAGEPALPGIALGHNEEAGFGFTIVGIDQGDIYVEKLDPQDPTRYLYKGEWRKMRVIEEELPVKGEKRPRRLALHYTIHGPVIAEDLGRHRAYALRWVGSEPGTAGYLGALRVSRARNWAEFESAANQYKLPSENLVYADRAGNIGWVAAGLAPIRKGWSGLLPVPGHTGEYEWSGFLPASQNPRKFNPPEGFIATANHNILPPDYPHALAYEWAAPFRFNRVVEMLGQKEKFSVADFEAMQQDVLSHPARLFQAAVKNWIRAQGELSVREEEIVSRIVRWDARLSADSIEAMIFELWSAKLPANLFGQALGSRVDLAATLRVLSGSPNGEALKRSLRDTIAELERKMGPDMAGWTWGRVHKVAFRHPVNRASFHRGPFSRPGDSNTVNNTGGSNFQQSSGASYREILDVSDWDKSVMTNAPGEVGNPDSPHYDDLIGEWSSGRYHPMLYSRKAVEGATVETLRLVPRP